MQNFDKLVHEKSRLAILTALRTNSSQTFKDLKIVTKLTDGVLSVQTKTLEDAKYIKISKTFVGRKPRTTYCITKTGQRAFDAYLSAMEALIAQVGQSAGRK